MRNPLRRETVVDKNGVVTTRNKRIDKKVAKMHEGGTSRLAKTTLPRPPLQRGDVYNALVPAQKEVLGWFKLSDKTVLYFSSDWVEGVGKDSTSHYIEVDGVTNAGILAGAKRKRDETKKKSEDAARTGNKALSRHLQNQVEHLDSFILELRSPMGSRRIQRVTEAQRATVDRFAMTQFSAYVQPHVSLFHKVHEYGKFVEAGLPEGASKQERNEMLTGLITREPEFSAEGFRDHAGLPRMYGELFDIIKDEYSKRDVY